MSFVNISILTLGGLLVAVPIILHLAMRPKPKEQVFPALRFLKQRQATNQRKMRLRQAILLMLRCLAIFLLALALARPSVASAQMGRWLVTGALSLLLIIVGLLTVLAMTARRGRILIGLLGLTAILLSGGLVHSGISIARNKPPLMLGDRKASVAAAILIDTSPRMNLRYQNQNRLDRAQDVSNWLLRQFPKDSQIAIVDRLPAVYSVDLGAAQAAVDALETTYETMSWSQRIDQTLNLLQQSDKQRKELYLLTDLTQATWGDLKQANPLIEERLAALPDVTVHVIDLGVEDPTNFAIADLQLSQSTLTPGTPLKLRAKLTRQGTKANCTAQLMMESPNGPMPLIVDGQLETPPVTVRGRNTVMLGPSQDQWVTFSMASLPYGTHHGFIQLEEVDGLTIDNRRDLTVHVRPPWSLLMVTGPNADPEQVTACLAPFKFRETGRAKFDFRIVPATELSQVKLKDYAAIGLLDPPPLDESRWRQLHQFVKQGGGLAVLLGRNAHSAKRFNSEAAGEVLPAEIVRIWDDADGLTITPRDYMHPILSPLQDLAATVPWEEMPVFRHWVVGPLKPQSQVVITLNNHKPLLLERTVGAGRVTMMTTPATDVDSRERAAWNWLPLSLQPLPFVVLIDRTFLYLVQSSDAELNYSVGQTARLPVDGTPGERFTVLTPRGTFQELTATRGNIEAPFTDAPGTYRLRVGSDATGPRGFSANLPGAATRLDRISDDDLKAYLGAERFQLATTEDEIVREIDEARAGREFYPFLLPLLAVLLAVEYVISNRFYPPLGAKSKPGGISMTDNHTDPNPKPTPKAAAVS